VRWAIIAVAGLVGFLAGMGIGSSRGHKARVMAERIVYRVISYGEWTRPRMRNFREQSRRVGNGLRCCPRYFAAKGDGHTSLCPSYEALDAPPMNLDE
jgi:hypothetical protein